MGKFTEAIGRKTRKHGEGSIEEVAISVPSWAPPELMAKAQAAMQAATKGVPLEKAPMAVIDPILQGMLDVFLAGYEACLHPGPMPEMIEAGAQHLLTQAAKDAAPEKRANVAKMFRRAAELYETP